MNRIIDHNVQLENYSEESLAAYCAKAKELHIDELHIVADSTSFKEFKPLFKAPNIDRGITNELGSECFKMSLKEYADFANEMKAKNFEVKLCFGICLHEDMKFVEVKNLLAAYDFDVVVGSVLTASIKSITDFYDKEVALCASGLIDVLALPAGSYTDEEASEYYDDVVMAAKEHEVALEVSGYNYYHNHQEMMGMSPEFIKLSKLNEVKLVSASHASCSDDVGRYLDVLNEAIKSDVTYLEFKNSIYLTKDFINFEIYDKENDTKTSTITFKPHTKEGTAVFEGDIVSDIIEFFTYMHEYYHVDNVISIKDHEDKVLIALGMKEIYKKDCIHYYSFQF